MYASLAITAAIAHRERTGVGQVIDLALFDSVVAFGATQILNYFTSGKIPGRYGNAHANVVPYEVFATADGHVILAVGNDSQFASFCKVAGRAELAVDARFHTMPDRIRNRSELIPLVREIMKRHRSKDWIERLEAANVPCGPINNYKEVFEDRQAQHRGLKVEIPHPSGVPRPTVASPMRFSETPVQYTLPPPLLGEHTREVLGELLGMRSEELDRLAAMKII
jgi:crotonobetainyl-CoA:carnitine CoA-transferase CaiB-like acyl-CoA transferase